jgi:hypothetical protein
MTRNIRTEQVSATTKPSTGHDPDTVPSASHPYNLLPYVPLYCLSFHLLLGSLTGRLPTGFRYKIMYVCMYVCIIIITIVPSTQFSIDILYVMHCYYMFRLTVAIIRYYNFLYSPFTYVCYSSLHWPVFTYWECIVQVDCIKCILNCVDGPIIINIILHRI